MAILLSTKYKHFIYPEAYPLSPTLEDIRKRWIYVTTLMLKAYPKFKIANMLVKDFGLSQSQSYIDIRNAENLFGKISVTESEAFKAMWIEWTKDFLKRSRQNKDLKAEAKALDLLAKYSDLDKEDLAFNPEKLEKVEVRVVLPRKLEKHYLDLIKSGVVDFNNLDVTDIEVEKD